MVKYQVNFQYTVEVGRSDMDKIFRTAVKAQSKSQAMRYAELEFMAFLDIRNAEIKEIPEGRYETNT